MTQTSILAPGIAAATSTAVVVALGETATIGIYSAAAGALPAGVQLTIQQLTPGADNIVATLDNYRRATLVSGPGSFRVVRQAYHDGALAGIPFGAFSES